MFVPLYTRSLFIYMWKAEKKKVNFEKYGFVLRKANDQNSFEGSLFARIYGTFLIKSFYQKRVHIDSE